MLNWMDKTKYGMICDVEWQGYSKLFDWDKEQIRRNTKKKKLENE